MPQKGQTASAKTRARISKALKGVKRPASCGANHYKWIGGRAETLRRFNEKRPYYKAFHGIKSRKNPCSFTLDQFADWWFNTPDFCIYCRRHLEILSESAWDSLSIDRKDNARHYDLDNIAKACLRCNAAKSSFFTFEQFKEIAAKYFTIKPL